MNVFDKPEEQNDACIDSALARKGRTKSKMILLNASPRKNRNTAQMLESVMGSPIYWSYPTGMFRNVIERLLFPILRYDLDEKTGGANKYIDKRMKTALIYTMNNSKERYDMVNYGTILGPDQQSMQMMFGSCEVLNAHETWQFFPDYSKYDASAFNMEHVQSVRDNQWPKDMEAAFEMGKRLVEMK